MRRRRSDELLGTASRRWANYLFYSRHWFVTSRAAGWPTREIILPKNLLRGKKRKHEGKCEMQASLKFSRFHRFPRTFHTFLILTRRTVCCGCEWTIVGWTRFILARLNRVNYFFWNRAREGNKNETKTFRGFVLFLYTISSTFFAFLTYILMWLMKPNNIFYLINAVTE